MILPHTSPAHSWCPASPPSLRTCPRALCPSQPHGVHILSMESPGHCCASSYSGHFSLPRAVWRVMLSKITGTWWRHPLRDRRRTSWPCTSPPPLQKLLHGTITPDFPDFCGHWTASCVGLVKVASSTFGFSPSLHCWLPLTLMSWGHTHSRAPSALCARGPELKYVCTKSDPKHRTQDHDL